MLDSFFEGNAQPRSSIDPQFEGAYRRGYHQAIAAVAFILKHHSIGAAELDAWVGGEGMHWRKDISLELQVTPPKLV